MRNLIHIIKNGIFIVSLITLGTAASNAQKCDDYHEVNCLFEDISFMYSRQSRSALFEQGTTSSMSFVAYGGEEYYITICGPKKWPPAQFKIFIDNSKKELIYDNQTDDFIDYVIFENNRTRKLILEVSIPENDGRKDGNPKCVGALIQFRNMADAAAGSKRKKTTEVGF